MCQKFGADRWNSTPTSVWPVSSLSLEYDATFLLFSTERVLQNKPLTRRDVGCQTDQCAMSTYHQGVRSFKERWPLFCKSVSENWNAQREPLAASLFCPGVKLYE